MLHPLRSLWVMVAVGGCTPDALDELSGAGDEGAHVLSLGWIENTDPGAPWVAVEVALDGDAPRTWRQVVDGSGQPVGAVFFDQRVRVEVFSSSGSPLSPFSQPGDEDDVLNLTPDVVGGGVVDAGPVRLGWAVAPAGEPLPNLRVDLHPGPPALSWLVPTAEAAPPLRLGMAEDDARAGWALTPARGSDSFYVGDPGGGPVPGMVQLDGAEVTQITLLPPKDACVTLQSRLSDRYGPPTKAAATQAPGEVRWIGAQVQIVAVDRGDHCTVGWRGR